MRFKITLTTGETEYDVESFDIFRRAVGQTGLNAEGARYCGCGVWELPKIDILDLEELAPDTMSLVASLDDATVIFEDAFQWQERQDEIYRERD